MPALPSNLLSMMHVALCLGNSWKALILPPSTFQEL